MGACSSNQDKKKQLDLPKIILSIDEFEIDTKLGQGGFGTVWKVIYIRNGENYAMKQMSKKLIIEKKMARSVMNERNLLGKIDNGFMINMKWAFQDREYLYLVMDQLTGGDLDTHMQKHKFTEKQAQFCLACLILALEYLREKKIIHRDIKPQNIVFDDKGYLRLTDMGIAKPFKQNNSGDTSGTALYMAPEVLCKQNHRYEVDYYAMGVLAYEFMFRQKPINGDSRKQIRNEILKQQFQILRNEVPIGWSLEAADFINKLLQRKPKDRLGYYHIDQIKLHPWFNNFDWDKLQKKLLKPSYVPKVNKQQETQNNEDQSTQLQDQISALNSDILDNPKLQQQFAGYEYYGFKYEQQKLEYQKKNQSDSDEPDFDEIQEEDDQISDGDL